MIVYFFKLLYRNNITSAKNDQAFFFEHSKLLLTQFTLHNMHFFNTKFLLYSIINFYNWLRLIIQQQWYICIIFEKTDMDILQILFQASHIGLIKEDKWIPGLLSNYYRICQGLHYSINMKEKNIQFTNIPDFFFFCSTEKSLPLCETNMQLIPQFVTMSKIITTLEKYFITLFIPKLSVKKNNRALIDMQKIVMIIKKNNMSVTTISHILNISAIEKYFITTKLKNIKNYLIYLTFLALLVK